MGSKKVLIIGSCLCLALAFGDLEKLEQPSKCRSRTMVCPCMDENGVQLNVTVKTCLVDHLTGKKSVCNGEAILTKCKRAYLSSERHRRNAASQTPNCINGTILPSQSSSALAGLPQVTINGYTRYLFVDEDVKFECTVNISKLSATVSWLFNGLALVAQKNRHEFLNCNTILLIKGVSLRDAGNYTCVVKNEVGQATASSYLSYERKQQGPHIEYVKLEGGSRDTAYTGSTVNLTCKTQDYNVQNSFLKDNSPIKEGDQRHYEYFHMQDKNKNLKILNLEIKNVTMRDAGNYTCFAAHDIGGLKTLESFHLKVVNLTATCPRGNYCPLGSVRPIKCPWGTYQPQVGQSSFHACKLCPDFKLNLSTPDPLLIYKPAANITDCIKGNPPTEFVEIKQPLPLNPFPLGETIGIVTGVIGTVIIVVLFYCIAKKKRWLSLYSTSCRTTNQHDPESFPSVFPSGDCQLQGLCENMQDAEFAQVVKKAPEIDYEPKYDVFICYSYKDVDWVKELFAELEKRGFICCIDFKDFVPGEPIVENISRAIYYSRKTIAVLTPDSVQSNWWTHELQKALTRIRFHQVVPIVYKSCEIPLILQDRTYLDWENCNVKPYFWDQLERALRQPNDGVI